MRIAPPASSLEFTSYTITTLPSDVLCSIFAKMEKFEDLAVCGSVCRRWNSILEQVQANSNILYVIQNSMLLTSADATTAAMRLAFVPIVSLRNYFQ